MERLISALDFYADIKYGSQKGFNQRELADFDSYFEFDDIIKDYWNSDISPEDRFFYYPLYIWWILTAVIPLRPREFLLTERDCIYKIQMEDITLSFEGICSKEEPAANYPTKYQMRTIRNRFLFLII